MSQPPQYRRQIEDEESVPLYKGDERSSLESTPSYPPRLGQSSGEEGQINVKFSFVPRWPVVGEEQHALCVLGRNKEVSSARRAYEHSSSVILQSADNKETTAMIQRYFPALAPYPADRIEYLCPIVDDKWGLVMDEAWPGFHRLPPSHLKVQVQDLPGDEAARE